MTVNYIENLFPEKRAQKSSTRVSEKARETFGSRMKKQMEEAESEENTQERAKDAPDFHREMLAFYERVEEQIKNGPPKFRIGSAEMSEDEWEKLLEKVDANLDAVKEEQEKRFAQQEEDAAEEKTAAHSEILTKADGSKVLAVTQEIGGTEITSYLKIDDGADGQLL